MKKKYWILIFLVILECVEIMAVARMISVHQPLAATVHTLIGIAFLITAIYSYKACQKNVTNFSALSNKYVIFLICANLFMLIVIAIHDMDHMRQAISWGYVFTLPLLTVNLIVYIPNVVSYILIAQHKIAGVWATIISGLLIAGGFLKLHLLGATIPVWGPWNRSFFALHVDMLTWWILAWTAIFGILLSLIATYILGREKERLAEHHR